jgi:hypothetical protein
VLPPPCLGIDGFVSTARGLDSPEYDRYAALPGSPNQLSDRTSIIAGFRRITPTAASRRVEICCGDQLCTRADDVDRRWNSTGL